MKMQVDATKCEAFGACADLCPSLFALDEWGYTGVIGDGTVPAGDEKAAESALAACPENAITKIG